MRVEQDGWHTPTRRAWVQRLADTLLAQPGSVVIAAHSLGCITTVHLPPAASAHITGALLVAPADPERRGVLVASDNDPHCPVRLAGAHARAWASDFVRLPSAGHVNVDSGHGDWPLGLALLHSLVPARSPVAEPA